MIAFERYRGIEFSDAGAIREIQEKQLSSHLQYVAAQSPYYRTLFKEQGTDIDGVTLDTVHTLPFTDKRALGKYNEDFRAVPMSEIVDIILSSGTTGNPTKGMYTENDLRRLAYNEAISLDSCGLTSEDVVLLTCTMDRCFIAGLAYFSGIRHLGAASIRNGLSSVESHRGIIQRMHPTAIVGVPTFLLKLGQYLQANGIDLHKNSVGKLICIGEPVRNRTLAPSTIGERLEEIWGAKIYSTYASSETITTFCECTAQKGGHLHPELAFVEIVNEQGDVLPAGGVGEVVVTPFSIEGMPFIRFKTGDISFLMDEPCECGRNSPRLGPILGRKKQMIKFRGTTLYPNSIYAVLDELSAVSEYYVTATSDFDLSDVVKVYVSVTDASCTADMIMDKLQAHLRVRPEVVIASEESIRKQVYAEQSRKLIRFIDKRKGI